MCRCATSMPGERESESVRAFTACTISVATLNP